MARHPGRFQPTAALPLRAGAILSSFARWQVIQFTVPFKLRDQVPSLSLT
jgi:hypothetical protein